MGVFLVACDHKPIFNRSPKLLLMRKTIRNVVIALSIAAPLTVGAQTIDLAALQAQVAALQAQIAASASAQTSTTPSTGAVTRCVALTRTLERGMTGTDVSALQTFLIQEGHLSATATGFFGAQTEVAVKAWQSARGIDPIGRVGPASRAALACSGGTTGPIVVGNQCPTIPKPTTCANAISVQSNGCTVGWQCSVATLPQQTFTATPLTGPTPLVVKFAGTVTSANAGFCAGNFCASTLVFGDGATGAVPLPNAEGAALNYEIFHTYTKGGPFIANLYQGAAGSGAPVVGNGITINPIAPVVTTPTGPQITVTPTFGTAPLNVTIMTQNVTSPVNLSVEFGDGTFGSLQPMGTGFGTTHTYNSGGSFTVKLRRTNGAGDSCATTTCEVLASTGINVTPAQVASAALVANPQTGLAPLPVTFFLNGGSASYSGGVAIDFGDNTTEYLCTAGVICGQRQIQHTYQTAGTYQVQLVGLNVGNVATVLKQTSVTVLTPQTTSLTASPSSGAVPLSVTFTGHGGNRVYPNGVVLKYGDDSSEEFCNGTEICGQKTKTHTYNDGAQYGAQLIGMESSTASTTLGTAVITATGGPTKIKVTGPTGTARKGESVSLSWTVRGTKPTTGTLSFDLYTNAGARIGTILSVTNFQSGSASWKIPSSLDKNCTTTQPNGLCGVNLTPGVYRIQAYASGLSSQPETTSDAVINIKDEEITPNNFTVTVSPSTAELGKPMQIKYKVANPPFNGGVALFLVKPLGEQVGVIATKLDADAELTTYNWNAGDTQPARTSDLAPGQYHVLAKVYTPFDANVAANEATVLASVTSLPFTVKAKGTGSSCIVLDRNMGPGDTDATTGGDVSRLQTFLAEDSTMYPEGTVSGFYGPATRRAVERYQASKGIATSGSPETNGYGAVGPSTRASISSNCSGNSDYLFRAAPLSGRAPLSVTFSAKLDTLGANETAAIDFGDGTSGEISKAVSSSVAHTYQVNGTYIAKLIINAAGGASRTGGTVSVKVTNTNTPSPQQCAAITRMLSADDTDATTGGDVSRLQQYLAADPVLYPEGLVTGFYGPATGRAVGRYQVSKGLTNTGTVGPQTLASIKCATDPAVGGIFSATPTSGASPLFVRFTTDRAVTTGSYRVDFGDGTSQWLSASSTTHTYSTNGTYNAQLVRSIGNCFGLANEALRLCELGSNEVLATKTISVSTPANMSIAVTPSSVAMGGNLAVNWTTSNPPAGSIVRLEVYRDGAVEPALTSNNDQGLASGSSNLAANGTFTWTLPANGTPAVLDGGFGGFVMTPGTYHITGKLYTGSQCWGFCNGVQQRAIHASGRSASFTVTNAGSTVAPTAGGGAVTGSVACINYSEMPIMARVTLSNGTTRDFEFAAATAQEAGGMIGGPGRSETQYADFAAVPSAIAGYLPAMAYYSPSLGGDRWSLSQQLSTSRTGGSITVSASRGASFVPGLITSQAMNCTVAWR